MKCDRKLDEEQRALVERALPLVSWTIRRYISSNESVSGLGFDDLYQEGCAALCCAAMAYLPDRGVFSTFAVTVIRNHLIGYCRKIVAQARELPSVSLEELVEGGHEIEVDETGLPAEETDMVARISIEQTLRHRKNRYTGAAKLGVEALELKVLGGYGVTEIARYYGSKPNVVGAWMSRAAKKIREDAADGELPEPGTRSA